MRRSGTTRGPSRRSSSSPTSRSRPRCWRRRSTSTDGRSKACATGSAPTSRRAGRAWCCATSPEDGASTRTPTSRAVVEQFVLSSRQARLTKAALETLAIVAYKQPVTRHQVSGIRGVNSDGVLRALVDRGLIEEAGRDETPGRPVLYATTPGVPRTARPALARLAALARAAPGRRRAGRGGGRARRRRGRRRRRRRRRRDRPPEPIQGEATRRRGRAGRRGRDRRGTGRRRPGLMAEERLQKALARAGFGSRRACEELIARGPGHPRGEGGDLGRQGRRRDPDRRGRRHRT